MLCRNNVYEITREGNRLLALPDGAIGRKLRRFVQRYVDYNTITQCYAYEQGHTAKQLAALEVYAKHQAKAFAEYLPEGTVEAPWFVRDDQFSLVSCGYKLQFDVETATVAQLRLVIQAIVVLAEAMHDFADSPNRSALADCPEYTYRNFPCSIVSDKELWCVSGSDVRGGSGVLEWCCDQADAQEVLSAMQRFPERFTGLKAKRWLDVMKEDEALEA